MAWTALSMITDHITTTDFPVSDRHTIMESTSLRIMHHTGATPARNAVWKTITPLERRGVFFINVQG